MPMPTTTTRKPVTRKPVTVLSWGDFVDTINDSDVCLEDAPIIDKMWERAQEGQSFVLSSEEEDLFNNLQNVA